MRLAGSFILVAVVSGLLCAQADAHWIRRSHWVDTQEVGRQQRANMAERTHQKKELMESARLDKERQRTNGQSTVRNYQWQNSAPKKRHHDRSALVHRARKPQRSY